MLNEIAEIKLKLEVEREEIKSQNLEVTVCSNVTGS